MKIFSDYVEAQLRDLDRIRAAADHKASNVTTPAVRALKRALATTTERGLRENLARAIAALLEQRGRR
jgi:hypothetical protein